MQKEKRNALIRFLLSVAAVMIGTAILGSMATDGDQAPRESKGRPRTEAPANGQP